MIYYYKTYSSHMNSNEKYNTNLGDARAPTAGLIQGWTRPPKKHIGMVRNWG